MISAPCLSNLTPLIGYTHLICKSYYLTELSVGEQGEGCDVFDNIWHKTVYIVD